MMRLTPLGESHFDPANPAKGLPGDEMFNLC